MFKSLSPEQYLQAREKLLSSVPHQGRPFRCSSKLLAYLAKKLPIIPPATLLILVFLSFNDLFFRLLCFSLPNLSFHYFIVLLSHAVFWGLVLHFVPNFLERLAPKWTEKWFDHLENHLSNMADHIARIFYYYFNAPFHDFKNELYHNWAAKCALFNPQRHSLLVHWLKGRNEWGYYEMCVLEQLWHLEYGLSEYLKIPKSEDDQQQAQAFYDRITSYREEMPYLPSHPGALRERFEELLFESQARHNQAELQSVTPPIKNIQPPTPRL
jgi:hypothetical protein